MKLNEGDQCVLLDTGKIDTVNGFIDHWYQIEYRDTIGWVFGSQTNIKSENSRETRSFLEQMENFTYALDQKDFKALNNFIHPETQLYCIQSSGYGGAKIIIKVSDFVEFFENEKYQNAGLIDMKTFIESFSEDSFERFNVKYEKNPRIGYQFNVKPGLFYSRLEHDYNDISKLYKKHINEGYGIKVDIKGIREREKKVVFKFIVTKNSNYFHFNFFLLQGKWYLLGITGDIENEPGN